MKYLFPILFLTISLSLFSQDKYFIYFKDKGPEIAKSGVNYESYHSLVSGYISERALERRKKNLPEDGVIDFKDLPIYTPYIRNLENLDILPLRKLRWLNAISARIDKITLSQIKNLPFVEKVEKVRTLLAKDRLIPSDEVPVRKISGSDYAIDYGFSVIQNELSDIPEVHELGFNGSGVLVGVLDTGFDWAAHDALKTRNVVAEYDFVNDDNITHNEANDLPSQHSHGTYVFSILGGYKEQFLVGPAYNASFMLAKTENVASETHAEEDDYAAAMEWLENAGVDITTSSLGYSEFDTGEESYTYEDMNGNTTIVAQAAKTAFAKGVVTVTSAGNEGNSPWYYVTSPGDEQNIITVGAVSVDNVIAGFSSRGPTPDGRIKPEISTMGVSVFGARASTTDDYQFNSGTSSAAPITAGITALLLDAYPHLSNRQVRKIIIESGDRVNNPDNDYGYGLLSAKRAISFPNVKIENNQVTINKIFADSLSLTGGNPQIFISYDSENYTSAEMVTSDNIIYNYDIGNPSSEDTVNFYFSYTRYDQSAVRIPETGAYKFAAGSDIVSLVTGLETREPIADDFYLFNNYPNPFNISTKIEFYTEFPMDVELTVYDILGRKVNRIYSGTSNKGYNTYNWDGRNDRGTIVSSGVYFYVLKSGDRVKANNMILMK